MESLEKLGGYTVSVGVMDTKRHGIPHHRARTYIVGLRQDVDRGTFAFPEPIPCPGIHHFLERKPTRRPSTPGLPPASQTNARKNVVATLRELREQARGSQGAAKLSGLGRSRMGNTSCLRA